MGLAIFYETLLVILVSALTAAVCLSSYLVTKRKTMLFACIAFMFYFFDVASILQDDYAARELASGLTQEYYLFHPLALHDGHRSRLSRRLLVHGLRVHR